MPFYRLNGLTVHMRGTRMPKPCAARVGVGDAQELCAGMSDALCDWLIGGGRTCDRPLCASHAHEVGRNKHYCPEHLQDQRDAAAQRGLFGGLLDGVTR